jgi:hypothetical protein
VPATEAVPVIAHAIQLAVAPVFLLTGVASLLGVMANRLARIIDRARGIQQAWPTMNERRHASAHTEIAQLERRRHLASWAINFSTCSALLVCLVVTALFADAFFASDLKWLAGALFAASMLSLIAGLACFLREVTLATTTVRILAIEIDS